MDDDLRKSDREFRQQSTRLDIDKLLSLLRSGIIDPRIVPILSSIGIQEVTDSVLDMSDSHQSFLKLRRSDLDHAGRLIIRFLRNDWELSNSDLWTLAAGLLVASEHKETAEKLFFLREEIECNKCGERFFYIDESE